MKTIREKVLNTLLPEIKSWNFILTCCEGGAAASGRLDPYSDLDLILCVEDEFLDMVFPKIEEALIKNWKIQSRWRLPDNKNYNQCYFKLRDTPEYFFVDVVVMRPETLSHFFEKERHGIPVIHFEREKIVQCQSVDLTAYRLKIMERVKSIDDSLPFYCSIIQKEILRNLPVDTLAFYRIVVGFLVELLGMKYRPSRFDFGLRYTSVDFPISEQYELQKFLFAASLEEIKLNLPILETKIQNLVAQIKSSVEEPH